MVAQYGHETWLVLIHLCVKNVNTKVRIIFCIVYTTLNML